MSNHQDTWERYVASWKAETEEEKRALYDQSLSPTCVYTDPLKVARGWDELVTYMREFHQQIPGGHFITERFIAHHDRSIAHWRMCNAAGDKLGDGVSYGEYDSSGKLVAMTGFFEVPASAA